MKRYKVVFSARAEANLVSIFRYIAKASSARIAKNYVDSIRQACEELSLFPERGTDQSVYRTGVRTTGFKRSATIVLRVIDDEVTVLNVFYRGVSVKPRL